MADKAIGELVAATSVTSSDLFVLEQNSTAKKLTAQILENWLTAIADGHGGIQTCVKTSTSGLVDTYTITYADTTTSTFTVTNGNGVTGVSKTGTSGIVDTYTMTFSGISDITYTVTNGRGISGISWSTSGTPGDGQTHTGTISYNDGTSSTIVFQDGLKGDTGEAMYMYVRYASSEPTSDAQILTVPDDWIGIYVGLESEPGDLHYTDYDWYLIKGDQGNPGDDITISSQSTEYQASSSGTVEPSGTWSSSIPVVAQGDFLWTRVTINFSDGNTVQYFTVSYFGTDGSGVGDMKKVDYDSSNSVFTAGGIPSFVSAQINSFENTLISGQSNISAEDDDDYLLIYSANDTDNVKEKRSAFLADVVSHEVIRVTTPAFSSLSQTFSATGVTADMVVLGYTLSNPAAQTGEWTITTGANQIIIAGSISGSTTLMLTLAKPSADVVATT